MSDNIVKVIDSLEDLAVLKELLKKAATIGSVEEFAEIPELNAWGGNTNFGFP